MDETLPFCFTKSGLISSLCISDLLIRHRLRDIFIDIGDYSFKLHFQDIDVSSSRQAGF